MFDPRTRINATESLEHDYVSPYHDSTDEPEAAEKFDWSFNDADLPVDTWKVMMYSEILGMSYLVRTGWRTHFVARLPPGRRRTVGSRRSRGCFGRARGPDACYRRRRSPSRMNLTILFLCNETAIHRCILDAYAEITIHPH